ncbi:hypothetical protein GIB67_003323 [Kingdonia uniflora]|uniref:Uncharacterized protein n=1 Tax=Kingdonia uniflora TaxID=39325 RepID=A0A7J7P8Q5_9MAGN|nr:hypothetical protein GIB67_003323 [Kingdonia uniflora]
MGRSSVNKVSTSGRTNESDSEGEGGFEQFLGFPGQLVSYTPGSDTFREFCKAKGAIGGRTWNDNIIWVKGNYLQRDDEELLELRFRYVKQRSQRRRLNSNWSWGNSARKKRVESRSKKVAKTQSTRSMTGIDEGTRKTSGDEVQPKTPGSGSSAQLNLTTSKIAHKFLKRQIKKVLLASSTTVNGEVTQGKRRRVEPLGGSEVEKRARLAIQQGKEDTNNMVEAKTNLYEMAEERDKLGRHLMLKGYSQKEVDVIKAETYAEEEEGEAEVLGVVNGLDGVSPQTVLNNQGDDVELLVDGSEKVVKEMSLKINDLESGLAKEIETSKALLSTQTELQVKLDASRVREDHALMYNWEFAEQFDRMKEVNENREDQYVKAYFRLEKLNQVVSDLARQVEEKDSGIRRFIRGNRACQESSTGSRTVIKAPLVHGDIVSLLSRIRELESDVSQIQGHVQRGNADLRECQYKLDATLIRERILEGKIRAKDLLVKIKDDLLKDLPAREELNSKLGRLRARVVELQAINLAESEQYIAKLKEDAIRHDRINTDRNAWKDTYVIVKVRHERLKARFAKAVVPGVARSDLLKGCTCGAEIDQGNCLRIMETQLGPRTADLVERGRADMARELKDRPLDDVGESIADTVSAGKNLL